MTPAVLLAGLAMVGGLLAAAGEARGAASAAAPELALALVTGASQPRLIVAQRQIERTWGLSEDSVYTQVEIPGWRSETTAAALSAAVPGAGQAYVGSRWVWGYALAEAAGLTAHWIWRRRGHELQNDAAAYVGSPAEPGSRWSFERWEQGTNQDASTLRALYAQDRNAFYDEIARDPGLLAGWLGNPSTTRTTFGDLRRHADDRLRYARYSATAVWINHLVSAVDALRIARLHNLPLGGGTRLGFEGGWRHGSPALTAALGRSF